MKAAKLLYLILPSLFAHFLSYTQTRIVLSTALGNNHYEYRKKQYIEAFNSLAKYGYTDLYIVEALTKKGPTFLDNYSHNVFYATCNDENIKNQGINESKTILEALNYYSFDPEDMIIKITGRHCLISDYFLKLVENNPNYDAFVKICHGLMPSWADGMVPTMCFAMKYKYLYEMYEQIDYTQMLEQNIPIEWIVADFINRKNQEGAFNVYHVDKIDIRVNAFASYACPGQPEKVFIF